MAAGALLLVLGYPHIARATRVSGLPRGSAVRLTRVFAGPLSSVRKWVFSPFRVRKNRHNEVVRHLQVLDQESDRVRHRHVFWSDFDLSAWRQTHFLIVFLVRHRRMEDNLNPPIRSGPDQYFSLGGSLIRLLVWLLQPTSTIQPRKVRPRRPGLG